jgi:hypothetical protein
MAYKKEKDLLQCYHKRSPSFARWQKILTYPNTLVSTAFTVTSIIWSNMIFVIEVLEFIVSNYPLGRMRDSASKGMMFIAGMFP